MIARETIEQAIKLARAGMPNQGMALLRPLVQDLNSKPFAIAAMAYCYQKSVNLLTARYLFTEAIRLKPDQPTWANNLKQCIDEHEKQFNELSKKKPSIIFFILAFLLILLGGLIVAVTLVSELSQIVYVMTDLDFENNMILPLVIASVLGVLGFIFTIIWLKAKWFFRKAVKEIRGENFEDSKHKPCPVCSLKRLKNKLNCPFCEAPYKVKVKDVSPPMPPIPVPQPDTIPTGEISAPPPLISQIPITQTAETQFGEGVPVPPPPPLPIDVGGAPPVSSPILQQKAVLSVGNSITVIISVILLAALGWFFLINKGGISISSPEKVMKRVAFAITENKPQMLWNLLPGGYQKDVSSLISDFANKMDKEIWNKSFSLGEKILDMLKSKKEFLLKSEFADASPEEKTKQAKVEEKTKQAKVYDTMLEIGYTLCKSDIKNLDTLKNINVQKYLSGTGSKVMSKFSGIGDIVTQNEYKKMMDKLKSLKATLVKKDKETAIVEIEMSGELTEQMEFVKIEGKWFPKNLVNEWKVFVSEARQGIEEMGKEITDNRATILITLAMGETLVDGLNKTKTQDEFNQISGEFAKNFKLDSLNSSNFLRSFDNMKKSTLKPYEEGIQLPKSEKKEEIGAKSTPLNKQISVGSLLNSNYVEDLGSDVKLGMVWISRGSFEMGSPSSEQYRDKDEGPVHRVELDGFWMGKYEVTQVQWKAIMENNPSYFRGDSLPVETVSWNNAMEFCKKLSEKTGKKYTLPSEAQWEYTCRAGSSTKYCFGDSDSSLGDYAWYASNSNSQTHPVGEKKPNGWGLYDMYGNVEEWCLDWYDENYYSNSPSKNPVNLISSNFWVIRGGSWLTTPWNCRSADRIWVDPDLRSRNFGFRVVRTLE